MTLSTSLENRVSKGASMRKAIIVPVNPHLAYAGGAFIGRVLPHITHIRRTGGVLWNCGRSLPYDHKEIKMGYFYETHKRALTYQFEIIRFIDWSNRNELERFIKEASRDEPQLEEAKFVPIFRFMDLIAILEEIETRKRAHCIGILIKAIYPLERPLDPRELIKVSDNKPLQTLAAVRAHPIVYATSRAKPNKQKMDPKEFLHSHIRKIIDEGEFDEKDIEDMLEYVLYDADCELVERQPNVKKGRIDLLYKKGRTFFVIELKKGLADITTLSQIQKYITEVKKKHHPEKLEGVIICETATKELKDAVTRIDGITLRYYKFFIDFGLTL